MNFKEGEVLYFDKPLRWTSFAVVNKIRYHISRKLGVKKIKVGHAGGHRSDDYLYRKGHKAY